MFAAAVAWLISGVRFTLDGETFELTPDLVRARLAGRYPRRPRVLGRDRRHSLAGEAGHLDRDGRDRASAFPVAVVRRWLANLGFTIGTGHEFVVHPRSVAPSLSADPPPRIRPNRRIVSPRHRPGGVCEEQTRRRASGEGPVRLGLLHEDAYLCRGHGLPWFILSAEHGLVGPNEWLEPYERYLPDTSRDYRRRWGAKVAAQLEQAIGSLSVSSSTSTPARSYVESVEGARRAARGRWYSTSSEGLSFGRRLSWYLTATRRARAAPTMLSLLQDEVSATTLADVIATGSADLRVPGMYSWWVDDEGAAELSAGLVHQVRAGLVYAGLAGATRSGGAASSNTLWGRIATMHLGKKHGFSTLRYSLGSILAETNGQPAIDEGQLTRWMYEHLRVIPIPVWDLDPDLLGNWIEATAADQRNADQSTRGSGPRAPRPAPGPIRNRQAPKSSRA